MHNLNVEFIAECVKTISEGNQCISCDKLNTPCVRYPCGHSACEACVTVAECCLLCVTPPSKIIHFNDESLSLRVQHASNLVSAFQDLFGVDVNRILSISKKLKLEKQLFPECIQAPNKYYNKRRSSNSLIKGKENRKSKLVLPGEEVSNATYIEMENRNIYVEEWVNNSKNPLSPRKQPRKPFADINVNQNQREHFTKEPQSKDNRKRKYFEAISSNTDSNNVPQKENKETIFKNNKRVKCYENSNNQEKSDVHESGIVIDDDVNEIMDSQEEVIDKDKLACLAVAESEPNVPFYKKGLLHTFGSATKIVNNDKSESMKSFDKVTKIIENESYIIKIIVSNCESVPCCSTSLADECSNVDKQNAIYVKPSQNTGEKNEQEKPLNVLTETSPHKSLLPENAKDSNNESGYNSKTVFLEESVANVRKSVIINDSDTDGSLYDIDEKVTRTVKFNKHSSGMVGYGVLATLQPQGLENRSRHARRGPSPRSSDSSEKENYNPNRMKRLKQGKNMKCKQILKKRYF